MAAGRSAGRAARGGGRGVAAVSECGEGGGWWPMKECLIGMAILAIAGTLLMPVRADHSSPPGAVVLKSCHGSTIYRLRDGRIVAASGYRRRSAHLAADRSSSRGRS